MLLATQATQYFADNWLSVLIAGIMVLGGGGGIAAMMRNRKEGPKILVDAAQGAVVVQAGVIEDLRDQILAQKQEMADREAAFNLRYEAQAAEIAELRTHMAELNSLRTKVRDLEEQNRMLSAENLHLSTQLKALTTIVRQNEERSERRV